MASCLLELMELSSSKKGFFVQVDAIDESRSRHASTSPDLSVPLSPLTVQEFGVLHHQSISKSRPSIGGTLVNAPPMFIKHEQECEESHDAGENGENSPAKAQNQSDVRAGWRWGW